MMRGSSGDPILNAMVGLRAAKRPFAVATVIETHGSVSAKTGAKAVIDQNGRVVTGWSAAAARRVRSVRPRLTACVPATPRSSTWT
jgi:xanthine/CO dehydrogenase XdhC/CoxF family maturation factor